ncbi:superoxide dismutase [Burkholderia pyrrocinia]|uniref:superoxide dismutase n=1 Tax=Burkholderia pyrrocinia TaxID=60550 RepID=UPI002AB30AA1|nr:superoxide dismutase [Burkholderia pyrrocinia]
MRLLCLDIPLPGSSPESYQPHLLEEVRHGWHLYKSGFVRDIYFRQDRPGVAIIVESESVDAARQALAEFPLAKVGLIDWEIIPLGPFVGWESLFASGSA